MTVRALYRVAEAMDVLSLSRSHFYKEVAAGRITIVKSGRSTRVTAAAVDAYVALLEAEAQPKRGAAA